MKTFIVGAGSDLGVHIDGAHLGPIQLMNDLKGFYKGESFSLVQNENIIKSRNLSDRRKNEYEIDKFNTQLYKTILEKVKDGYFPITIGGDHSVAVASALASAKVHDNIGIIWFDAHTDYNTFEANFVLLGWSHRVKSYKTPSRKKAVQYILSGIEEHYLACNQELTVHNFSIEHIANDDGSADHCKIGNLLMLAEPINGGAADKVYTEKIPYYKRSNFVSTQKFVELYGELADWSDSNIINRGKYMAKLAYDTIWKF